MMNLRQLTVVLGLMVAALPASSSYQLGSYGFGTGGTSGTSSGNYSINGIAGDAANGQSSSTNYKVGGGANYQQQADVPLATLTNAAMWYNKLRLNIFPNGNSTNTKYAVAISTDNFVTTKYIRSDLTIGTTLDITNFQSYGSWGGGGGVIIRGLSRSSVYTVKAAAYRGNYTQSAFGPTSSGTTTNAPQLSFHVDVSAIDQSTSPPYVVSFGNLLAGSVNDAPVKVWVSLDTNAESGGLVYLNDLNSGLASSATSYNIASSSSDLSSLPEGYGVQGTSATQSSGGPLALAAPFNGAGQNVGALTTVLQEIFNASAPVTAGRGSFLLKAKTSTVTPASGDYSDILTAVAAASF
jgi:hypothetical protein